MKLFTFPFFLLFVSFYSFSQETTYKREKRILQIKKSTSAIQVDGVLDEQAWKEAELAANFHQIRPYDSSYAQLKTESKITFDDKNIYVSAICYQKRSDYTISSLKRDFESGSSDVYLLNLDTYKDGLNGFQFAVTPLNVQRESLIIQGEDLSIFWDNKWYSAVKNYDNYWIVEMAIPFKSIRYKVGDTNIWGINFARNVMVNNEISSWSPVPRNFKPVNLAYAGELLWTTPPPIPGANISLIPFVSASGFADYPRNEQTLARSKEVQEFGKAFGMDAKIAVSASLNLDLTVNPDFSQVEVDRQQTNLSRFELFYPERRQFFLENSDLFGTFGFPDTRPFFSRRIGIARNPITGNNQPVKIIAGARLSGKLNNNLRIGLLNAQTKKVNFDQDNIIPTINYTVATVQQKLFDRSTIGAIFANKSSNIGGFTDTQKRSYDAFNRVAGLEFNFFSKNNRIEAESYFHKSFSPNQKGDATSIANYIGYHHPNADINLGLNRIGQNYKADVGFVPRTGIYSVYWPMEFTLNPKNPKISKFINAYGIGNFDANFVFDLKGKLLDNNISPFLFVNSPSGSSLFTSYSHSYTYLFYEFDPTNSSLNPDPDVSKDVKYLPIGGYRTGNFILGFESSERKNISGSFSFSKGGFYNGKSTTFEGDIKYRIQPFGSISMSYAFYDLALPKPYNQVKYWLVGPKAEFSFSKSVFFSNFFQYNTQTNNFNINSRLQWRFKPVSDMFLVYTDNRFATNITKYGVEGFAPKNRALVFKLTYWFNA